MEDADSCDVLSLVPVLESHHGDSLHKTANAVSKKLAARLQCAVYPDVVFGCKEKIR